MLALLPVLWPLFSLIALGQILKRTQFLAEGFWAGAEKLNYFVLFPALLFSNLSKAPLDNPQLLSLGGAVLLVILIAWIGLLTARHFLHWPAARFGPLAQGILRFNTYLGLAITSSLFGAQGLMVAALILGVLVPTANVLSVWALTADRPFHIGVVLSVLKNPMILACLTGASVNLLGIPLPQGSDRLLSLLAAGSLPLGLLCVGAAIQLQEMAGERRTLAKNAGARLVLMPLLAFWVGYLLGLPTTERVLLTLFFALPTAPTAYSLTRQLGGDSSLMANLITLQTLLAAFSLPLVLSILM